MSLDIYLEAVRPTTVFSDNITHNYGPMAKECGIYKHIWRPEELEIKKAAELIVPLTEALGKLKSNPEHFKKFQRDWASYDGFVSFVKRYLKACVDNPDATITANR